MPNRIVQRAAPVCSYTCKKTIALI